MTHRTTERWVQRLVLGTLAVVATTTSTAVAGDDDVLTARTGVDMATTAARVWADDAVLVYVENDEPLVAGGEAERWGFLYHSALKRSSRAYSVEAGKVVLAEDFDLRFDPPAVSSSFVDSDRAAAAANKAAGADFVKRTGGTLETMLLMRGAFHDDDPNATTWVLIYRADDEPPLTVVIDAADGSVARTWRG